MRTTRVFKAAGTLVVGLVLVGFSRAEGERAGGMDDHTIALWLFDDAPYPNAILTDAGPYHHDLRLKSEYAKWWERTWGAGNPDEAPEPLHVAGQYGLVQGKFGGGLRLPPGERGEVVWPDNRQPFGNEFVNGRDSYVPERLNIGYFDWTIEFWHKAAGTVDKRAAVFDIRNEQHSRTSMKARKNIWMANSLLIDEGRRRFVLVSRRDDVDETYAEVQIPTDPERLNDGQWHHYAFTYSAGQRQVRHYVDGRLQPLPIKGGFLPMMSRIASLRMDNHLNCVLDEMRISDVVRYTSDFEPPGSFSRNYAATPRETNRPNGPPPLLGRDGTFDGPVHLGSRKHLFIDEALIDRMDNVQLTANPPGSFQVTNFRNDKPWEPTPRFGSTIPDVCSVWDEGEEIRMLYTNGGFFGGKPHVVCYATSKDGLNWDKPTLGLKCWGGSVDNNIVLCVACQGSVVKDPNPAAPADERYKYAAWCMYWGYYVFTSPDGIHWRRNETCAMPIDPDGSTSFYWDDQRGLYQGYVRGLFNTGPRRRVLHVTMREFLKPWPFKPVDRPNLDDTPLTMPVRGELPLIDTGGQVYRFKAHKYPWAPDTYVAFPWRYIADGNIRPGSFLMVSRDGENWKGYEPPYYFASGWELDGRKVLEALTEHGMIRRGDEIWQYGTVRFTEHGGVLYGGVEHEGGTHDRLLRLTQRLDGFVSLDTKTGTGTVVTKPLVFEGQKLELNISARGSARVALLDEAGRPLAGFDLEDCDPAQTDSVRQTVTWKKRSEVGRLAGKVVRLKFELEDTKLYAFQFVASAPQ
jgi:hypothetical protein